MDLNDIDLLSLQTSYMQRDRFVQALCKALNPYFQQLSDNVKLVYIYGRIDELDEGAIDSLAWQFHVDFYDYSLPISKKRELVKQSKILHRIKGTPVAVERAATTVFGKTKLREWFEYSGEPYFFGLDIDVTDQGVTEENIKKLETLIYAYKNERSWLDYIHMYLTNRQKLFYGTSIFSGEEITVYPYTPKEIGTNGKITIGIGWGCGSEVIEVYPKVTTHKALNSFTHKELSSYTHGELGGN